MSYFCLWSTVAISVTVSPPKHTEYLLSFDSVLSQPAIHSLEIRTPVLSIRFRDLAVSTKVSDFSASSFNFSWPVLCAVFPEEPFFSKLSPNHPPFCHCVFVPLFGSVFSPQICFQCEVGQSLWGRAGGKSVSLICLLRFFCRKKRSSYGLWNTKFCQQYVNIQGGTRGAGESEGCRRLPENFVAFFP